MQEALQSLGLLFGSVLHQSEWQAHLSLGSPFIVPFLAMNCSVHRLPHSFVRTLLGVDATLKLGNSEFRVLKTKI